MNRKQPSLLLRTYGAEHFASLMLRADYLLIGNMNLPVLSGEPGE